MNNASQCLYMMSQARLSDIFKNKLALSKVKYGSLGSYEQQYNFLKQL
jgi:hypothetical protein